MDVLSPDLQAVMASGKDIMGFTPNDGLIMARKPTMLKAFLALVQAIYEPGLVSLELKKLVALMTSSVSGCQYCQAHTSFGALNAGVAPEKVAAIWEYQNHVLFSDNERVALDIAREAAMTPSGVTDAQFVALRSHFSDEQIVELVGVISLFGFLNRWNATLDTDLEPEPKAGVAKLPTHQP